MSEAGSSTGAGTAAGEMETVLRRLKRIEEANARIEERLDGLYDLLVEKEEKGSEDGDADG